MRTFAAGSTSPVGLFGEQRNVTIGRCALDGAERRGEVEREVGGAVGLDDRGAGEPGDVAVQLVRRLERGDGAARAGVGEQQRLQHLVRPVGGEHLLRRRRRAASAIAARSAVAARSG